MGHFGSQENSAGTELLLRVGQGDAQAFETVYRLFRPVVSGFIAKYDRGVTHHDRESMVQEVFVRTWRNRKRFRGDASAKTYLLGVATNVIREYRRRRRAQTKALRFVGQYVASSSSGPGGNLEVALEREKLAKAVARAISKLSPKQRQALKAVVVSGIPIRRAARLLGCSESTLRRRLSDARKRVAILVKRIPPS